MQTLIPILGEGFAEIGEIPGVEYQKTLGMIGMCGFTSKSGGSDFARKIARIAMERGLFIRPLGDVLYLWPPLVTTPEQLHERLALFRDAIRAASYQTT